MPTIRTFAEPVNDQVTVHIPEEYRSYSFQVVLVPVAKKKSVPDFVDFLCSCPVDASELDLERDTDDGNSREEAIV